MQRRTLLKTLAGATVSGAAYPLLTQASSDAPMPSSGWTRHGQVVTHSGPPEGGWFQCFTSPAEPLDGETGDRWRLWGSVSGSGETLKNVGFAEGSVEGGFGPPVYAELSTSDPVEAPLSIGNLPDGWRPVQGVHLRLQNGTERLYFWAHGPGIVRYLAADSTDGRAFRVVNPLSACIYHPSDRAVSGSAAVEAGLPRLAKREAKPAPGEALAPARLISNDATNVYQLPDGSFEMYSVALMEVPKGDPRYFEKDNVSGWVRVIDRYASEDGLHWTDRQRVIAPDGEDPIDQQFYFLSVTTTEVGRIGLLGHYRLETQTIDLEWCHSEDGITWRRPARKPWLARSAPGEALDSYMLHAPHSMVKRKGRWWLFYTGGNFAHNHKDNHGTGEERAAFCASIPELWV